LQKQTIDTEFRGQLGDADVVLALLSPKALAHTGILFEIGAAQASGKKIVPIMLPDTNLDQIDFLDRSQTILDAATLSPSETAKRIEALISESDFSASPCGTPTMCAPLDDIAIPAWPWDDIGRFQRQGAVTLADRDCICPMFAPDPW
jgi:hypothetical protein